MKFYVSWRTYSPSLLRTQLQLHFQWSLRNTLTRDLILMMPCKTETGTNAESLTIQLLLQQSVIGIAISLLVSGLTVFILSTFCGVFMVHCVKLMRRIFWIWGFTVWLFCVSLKCNLSETFYQVWALRRWGGRQIRSYTLTLRAL